MLEPIDYYLAKEVEEEMRIQRRPKCLCCGEPINTERFIRTNDDDVLCWDCIDICNIEELEDEVDD